jgi:hypothetical protein
MKKYFGVLVVVGLMVSSAIADPSTTVYNVSVEGSGYGMGGLNGGAFTVRTLAGGANWAGVGYTPGSTFSTFCTESMVTGFGGYATIDNMVYWDGTGPKVLSQDLKEVYAIYATQGLAGLGLADTAVSNEIVQAYIWQELGYSGPNTEWQAFFTGHASDFAYLDTLTSTRAGEVYALNTWANSNATGDRQSQLILVAVPAPGAALLIGLGLSLVGWIKRRIA